ncbi:regulatory protein RecX [Microbacterium esteraromaticum]|uniref:Regulatory protein RecX n=1 Tax=Microbacterium esteraromaticum TaxID=57043 RepID=A0A7D7WAA9_9MICO|nr:regulatory protein RecX [Microbacterium esteraromaticum]QMU97956.1 regulatory protein RecX [Microbacterium esteraromaticum]
MQSADADDLAPIIPLFGGRGADPSTGPARPAGARFGVASDDDDVIQAEPDAEEVRRRAEDALVRKLRAKQLSVSESRSVLRENDLDRDAIEDVIDEFLRRGYLDDRTLASLLVTSGSERKGQGRIALARSLAQRGIPREVIDDALEELPDDDAERALEFARGKAPGMSRLDYDTALRRLHGQLARRGYGGSVAMDAARTALSEVGVRRASARTSGVRFVDSE